MKESSLTEPLSQFLQLPHFMGTGGQVFSYCRDTQEANLLTLLINVTTLVVHKAQGLQWFVKAEDTVMESTLAKQAAHFNVRTASTSFTFLLWGP